MPKHIFKNTPEDEYYKIKGCKYICEGFQTDVDIFLDEYKKKGSVRYEDFAKIWRKRSFDCIYIFREEAEIDFFIDECFKILLKLFATEEIFTVKVGILYLIYGVYFRQPVKGKVKIRVTLKQIQEFQSLAEKAQSEFHYDASYIFWSLFHKNAFLFVYRTEIGDGIDPGYEPAPLEKRPIFEQFITEEQIDNLSLIHERYSSLKSIQDSPEVKHLSVYDPNLIATFKKKVQDLKQKFKDPDYVPSVTATVTQEEHGELNSRQSLKNRAFLSAPEAPKSIVSKFVDQPSTSKKK